jgi:hypothetical protein
MNMNDTHAVAAGLGILTIALVVLAIMLVPAIFYLLIQKALNRCSPECRAMNPGMVWLMFIPLFNIVWHFFVVMNMAKSLGCEFQKRGTAEDPKPGQTLGLVMCILFCCGIIPILGVLCSLGGFVCWIIYWVKIADYSSKIAAPPAVLAARIETMISSARSPALPSRSGRRSSDARRARRHPFPNASSARTSPLRPC